MGMHRNILEEKLRDRFAAAALTGLLADSNLNVSTATMTPGEFQASIAYSAYCYAEAMMTERADRLKADEAENRERDKADGIEFNIITQTRLLGDDG